jgi:gas vesicle protein
MYKPYNMKWSLIFLSGVGLGIVVGLLVAPEPGRVTLLKAKAEADRIVDKVLQKERLRREAQQIEEPVVSAS